MAGRKFSLRLRVFFSMILLVVMTSILILGATFYQYYAQSDDYNLRRLERKETQVKNHLSYVFNRDGAFSLTLEKQKDFYKTFESIAQIHKVDYALFNMEGSPYFYSYVKLENTIEEQKLDPQIINSLVKSRRKRIAVQNDYERGTFQSSYSVLFDDNNTPYAILYFPYFEDVSFSTTELNAFLVRLFQIYFFMLIVAIIIAYFISSYMTRPLETIRARIDRTGLLKGNEKIVISNASKEVDSLVNSYNSMLDALEESIAKLARSEREQAWQEMAKQVAHEIKNPLTPMRLTVQSFQQRFDPNDPNIDKKVIDFSKIMIEQIDTMSKVANAFSNFATLPKLKLESVDLVEITRFSIDIFDLGTIKYSSSESQIIWDIDRTQWIRIMTNLLQNAIQSVPQDRDPEIRVHIEKQKEKLRIEIQDNGSGISEENIGKIFEPKFTTKTAGMGLGLAIVKNSLDSLGGKISYKTTENQGTKFIIELKKQK
ncbi:ATP-binding protein [Flavobacteriaceae bacterium]|uniref:sensor histidine kinase n=1 Tax=Candidatus Arcticimaribacter forsetii TaxID=2820661 RepID=UPI00207795EE|nr:ATP-binding protein [Candidatus Arcticimaribacter forsetii]MDA8699246.1 ATP-binding protein [Flavobacteriaceae bacterium]MDB2329029.1 ATP-binding protein [Flavobacteriaceae bacterium]MDB2345354.1 ATP-binding protein [Flavobacteriaceae bacterium]MDB4674368.1 ATP-binding protein [Flavobacteriaceae bacterium]MDB4751749.1 ATP-binding protein [Flavobacteriaceae bacterium]